MPASNEPWAGFVAALFEDERPWFSARVERAARLLDELHHVARRHASAGDETERVKRLGRFLFGERRYAWRHRAAAEDFTLTGILLNQGGNCLGLTTLYCAVAGSCGLPVAPLLFEAHVAPCLCDGARRRLVDDVRRGALWPDRLAELRYGPLSEARLLDPTELRAVHLSNRGAFVLAPSGERREALRELDEAVDLFPDYCGARINRATVFFELGLVDEARHELERIFALAPKAGYRRAALQLLSRVRGAPLPLFHEPPQTRSA